MKKITIIFLACLFLFMTSASYAIYETLPRDIGSNSEILNILNPEEDETINYSETYLVSCMAEPGTEITLYEKYDNDLYVPMTVDNEAITGTVGSSGMFLVDLTFNMDTTNEIMFFAEKDNNYHSVFKTITVKDKSARRVIKHTILNIQNFVSNMFE